MLTATELERLPIVEDVLEFVPEVVARRHTVLPVRYDAGTLQVIVAADTAGRIEETIQTLEFVLERKISFDVADRDQLASVIDLHYSAVGSMVRNCPRTFRFRCPKRWVDLERIGEDRVRHCDSCGTKVRLCKDDDELNAAIARGECVAYYDSSEAFLGILCDDE